MIWLLSILIFFYGVLVLTYIFGWVSTPNYVIQNSTSTTKVTVLIPARNEEENVNECLAAITNQNYPKELIEVIVVNDNSTDNTTAIANGFANVKVLQLQGSEGKKAAITYGVQQALGELIVTTDADCVMGENWLATLVSYYELNNCKMIAAPVMFHKEKSFLEKFQVLDFAGMMGVTAASIKYNLSSMCNGANLAYTKVAFMEVNGFEGIDNVPTGDDLLLMEKIKKLHPKSVKFLKSKEAIVYTKAQPNFKALENQRVRWTSKAKHYSDWKIKAILLLVLATNIALYGMLILSIFNAANWMPLLSAFIIKSMVDFAFLWVTTGFFNKRKWLWLFLPMQFLHIYYIAYIGIIGNFKSYNWKGRKVSNERTKYSNT